MVWLVVVGLSVTASGTPKGASETALAGDLVVRARTEGRPGATLGLIANLFLLWNAAEPLVPSPFWSLPSLKSHNSGHMLESSNKIDFKGHLVLATHPWTVGFSDGVTTDWFSVTEVLLSLTSLGVSLASWLARGAS